MKKLTKAEQEKAAKIWAKIIARAWEDELFKQRLLKHTEEVFNEYGLSIPEGVTLKILEETAKSEYLILPRKPKEELSTQELQKIAAAGGTAAGAIWLHNQH